MGIIHGADSDIGYGGYWNSDAVLFDFCRQLRLPPSRREVPANVLIHSRSGSPLGSIAAANYAQDWFRHSFRCDRRSTLRSLFGKNTSSAGLPYNSKSLEIFGTRLTE